MMHQKQLVPGHLKKKFPSTYRIREHVKNYTQLLDNCMKVSHIVTSWIRANRTEMQYQHVPSAFT